MVGTKTALALLGLRFLEGLDAIAPSRPGSWRAQALRHLALRRLRERDIVQYRVEIARDWGAKVGSGCRFYSLNIFSEPYLVEFGDNVIVSGNVIFLTHDGAIYLIRNDVPNIRGSYGGIRIGNNCFIGMNAIILPNVHIGDNCIVGAGAVVTRSFGDDTVIMGNPARAVMSMQMYRDMKLGTPGIVVSETYPFPGRIPDAEKRRLLMARYDELMPAPPGSPDPA